MKNRREFIKLSSMAAGLFTLQPANATELINKHRRGLFKGASVISTWDFGKKANELAWKALQKGESALGAVESGVKLAESDPNERSVGFGGRPDKDGKVTLDACIMNGNGDIGSVACLEHIKNPISVARAVMEKTNHVMLVGPGALQFALGNGFKKENLLTPESEREWKEWVKSGQKALPKPNIENHDTIAMLAIDTDGQMAGACTTSGMAYKLAGRVGDSPIIGAGLFVDNEVGAAAATGQGEEVIRIVGSHLVVEFMRQGMPPGDACREAVHRLLQKKSDDGLSGLQIGFIAMNKFGETGAFALRKGFTYALKNESENELIQSEYLFD